MKVGFYGHVRQYHNLKEDLDKAILDVLESGAYVMGPAGTKFEEELAAYSGTKYAVGCNSGTDAIWLVLMALGNNPPSSWRQFTFDTDFPTDRPFFPTTHRLREVP